MPSVRERWKSVYGKYPDQADVDNMFTDFVPMQIAVLKKYSELIPGTVKAVDRLRNELGCKIGVTTGFTRSMVDVLLAEAKKQGYEPDVNVAGDEVAHGARPKPFMVYRNLDLLDVPDIYSVVKVDDTVSGVGEALSAGCWAVGVARHSNYMDVNSLEEEADLSEDEIKKRLAKTRQTLTQTGAHYVIDTIAELPDVVEKINQRLALGDRP